MMTVFDSLEKLIIKFLLRFETVFVFGVLTCVSESLQQKNFGLKTLKHFSTNPVNTQIPNHEISEFYI